MSTATRSLVTIDDPALRADPDLARAREILVAYRPADDSQRRERDRVLDWIARRPRTAHRRSCLEGHLTASALLVEEGTVEEGAGRVLLLHHRKLDRWIQPGGHCDGDANLPGVALRECLEETGIDDLAIVPEVIDVDIHTIPERPGEPEHLHFDTRFLVVAPRGAAPRGNDESHALRWSTPAEALALGGDESVRRLVRQAMRREGEAGR